MSLSKAIIYGTVNDVEQLIQQGTALNEIDEYGYSPLVQTAIVNEIEKTRVLLQAGADINFSDLTGRTALHWACDNENVALSELLLVKGADANAYTRAGQSVLVLPLLRNHKELKQLLYRYGANINFALDFINGKLLGHRFALEGRIDIVDHKSTFIEIELEGFYVEFSLAIFINSLQDFVNNFAGRSVRNYFNELSTVISALEKGFKLIRYQHYLSDHKQYQNEIENLLQADPLILPVSYDGHAISLVKMGQWLVRCDRGAFGRDHGTVIFYKLENLRKFNIEVMKFLLYKRQHREFIEQQFEEALSLKVVRTLPLPPQISGNCSWANIEASLPALLFLLLLNRQRNNHVIDIEVSQRHALRIYEIWQEWDKQRALHFCLQSFGTGTSARKAAKATLLAAILFQYCQYGQDKHMDVAEKILSILGQADYHYILKSYLRAFADDHHSEQLKNFRSFIDDYGINVDV